MLYGKENEMDLWEWIKVLILGIVEGITEWLPISSTGHMILVDEFIKLDVSPEFMNMFLVVIQLGAILAVVVLYWQKIWPFHRKTKDFGPLIRIEIRLLYGERLLYPAFPPLSSVYP